MNCRDHCGACCTAPSITSPIPGMPNGKPAGVRCVQLDDDNRCRVFGKPERPAFCGGLQPAADMCGDSREYAMVWLAELERATAPAPAPARSTLKRLTKPLNVSPTDE
jgi:Fe-S-cluster containining protein